MKKSVRLKFIIGIVFVLAICASLFIFLDYSMSRATARTGQLESDSYTVGVDYSGIITDQFISEGSYVEVGDPLFELRSSTLAEAIRDNDIAATALLYSVTPDGTVLISAAAPGRVQSIAYRKGAFVAANNEIAVINNKDGLYTSATFILSAPDYALLDTNSRVNITLPDGRKVTGTVYDITLDRVEGEIETTVRARFDNKTINTTAFSVGTPVQATLELRSDTLYDKLSGSINSLYQSVIRN